MPLYFVQTVQQYIRKHPTRRRNDITLPANIEVMVNPNSLGLIQITTGLSYMSNGGYNFYVSEDELYQITGKRCSDLTEDLQDSQSLKL